MFTISVGKRFWSFLRRHEQPESFAFLHYDFQPSPLGSWFFHDLRMRTDIAKPDGVLSAVRAPSGHTLVDASCSAALGFASGIYGAKIWKTPTPRVLCVFVPYAALVVGNILVGLVPSMKIRSATSVMMLGPLTALRPPVMVAGVPTEWQRRRYGKRGY